MYYSPWSDEQRWNQFWCSNYAYYDDQEYDWTNTSFNYNQLKNVNQMIAEAKRIGLADNNPYAAIGKFMKAYYFVDMSMKLGDVPLTEALKSLENTQPKYDSQKAVFKQALTWLEEANSDLQTLIDNQNKSLTGDFMLGNDLIKWQKVVNTYKLRILINLSKKEADTDLNIKKLFSDVVSNPAKYPVVTSLDDNLKFTYNSSTDKYPLNQDNYGQTATRNNMSATYLNTLVALKDPRTFIVADPAPVKIQAGLTAADFDAYIGASSGESLDDMSTKMLNGEYSANCFCQRFEARFGGQFFGSFGGSSSSLDDLPQLRKNECISPKPDGKNRRHSGRHSGRNKCRNVDDWPDQIRKRSWFVA